MLEENIYGLEPVTKLSRKDIVEARKLSDQEVRFLVNSYYQRQEDRIRSGARTRALTESGEPNLVVNWLAGQDEVLEGQLQRALKYYVESHPVGVWATGIYGIGTIITAGLLANIDVTIANTAGKVWAYAGLIPGQKRVRGQKSTWNPALKRLAYLIGESFVKVSGKPESWYGQLYKKRKEYEIAKNEAGEYAEQAVKALEEKNYGKDTDAYKAYSSGKLPPAHIHRRACRYAAKMFLSHFHEKLYVHVHGTKPPLCYAVAQLNHADYISPDVVS